MRPSTCSTSTPRQSRCTSSGSAPKTTSKGLLAGTPGADRAVGYLCKYLTKSIAGTHGGDDDPTSAREAHIDRLAEEVRWLP
jgi:hypothetical protein